MSAASRWLRRTGAGLLIVLSTVPIVAVTPAVMDSHTALTRHGSSHSQPSNPARSIR